MTRPSETSKVSNSLMRSIRLALVAPAYLDTCIQHGMAQLQQGLFCTAVSRIQLLDGRVVKRFDLFGCKPVQHADQIRDQTFTGQGINPRRCFEVLVHLKSFIKNKGRIWRGLSGTDRFQESTGIENVVCRYGCGVTA